MYVTSADLLSVRRLKIGEKHILPAAPEEDAVAIQMQELFTSITEAITASLEVESQLTIEISGSLGLKVEGGTKYLFFNVAGQAEATGAMKVVLSTKIKPKIDYSKNESQDSRTK